MNRQLKIIILCIWVLIYPYTSHSQSSVFNNVYNDYSYQKYSESDSNYYFNNEIFYKFKESKVNTYTLYGSSTNHSYFFNEYISYNYIVDVDEFGDTLKTKTIDLFVNDNREGVTDGINVNKYEYLIGAKNNVLLPFFENINAKIIKLDPNRDTIWTREYNMGDDNKFVTIKTNDNGTTFQVLGFADVDTNGINYDAFISTIDSSGNLLSNIQIGGILDDFLYAIEYLDNGNYLLCGHTFNYNVEGSDIWLLEMETNGNVVWQKFYGGQYYERIWNAKGMLIMDDYIYITGTGIGEYMNNGIQEPTGAGWVLKLDMQGNLIWDKLFVRGMGIDYFNGIQKWDDKSLILGGTISDYTIGDYVPSGWLIKIDTSGKIIWERTIQKYTPEDNNGSNPHHYVYDMLVSSDKGILLGGYIIANYITDENGYYHRNDAWLTKTDSCGFTVGDVPQPNILIDSIVKRKVYLREKSQDYCTAQLTWGDQSQDTSYYAYENNLPLQEKQFIHTFAENGEYTIKTTTLAGEEFREASITVNIYYKEDSIIAPEPPVYGLLSIFPNPTVNFATIQNPLSQTKDLESFTVEMYSINGKRIQSYKLNPKLYQQQINVSKLSNGVYYVKFVIDNELVETVKVVIAKG